jgi:5-methylcytosine-specific restriction protein B
MDPYGEQSVQAVYDTANAWKERCLLGELSLFYPDRKIWTLENVDELDRVFNREPLTDSRNFADKLDEQLAKVGSEVRIAAAEVLSIYYLVPNPRVVGAARKQQVVERVLGDSVPESAADLKKAWAAAPWFPGQNYLQRPDLHVGYLIDFARRAKVSDKQRLRDILSTPSELTAFADDTEKSKTASRNMLVHFICPQEFVSVAAGSNRRALVATFEGFIDPETSDHDDDRLRAIVRSLEKIPAAKPGERVKFYAPPLEAIWRGGNDDEIGQLEALEWKKNLCLYGPPGTGKTFSAMKIAEALIRRSAMKTWGVQTYFENADVVDRLVRINTHTIQLHPGWDYASFVVGLTLNDGATRWEPGEIFRVLQLFEKQNLPEGCQRLPVVLVLDEINRTDLSAMLGELFSLLERDKRGQSRELPSRGHDGLESIALPDDLYVIGTMNDIDQSVESLDFALRRRFLWSSVGFDAEALVAMVSNQWESKRHISGKVGANTSFDELAGEIDRLVECAERLNDAIGKVRGLGPEFVIGHTYFAEIVEFVSLWLEGRNKKPPNGTYLWTSTKEPQPPLHGLWNLSLKPLLEQYLAGSDDREHELDGLRTAFLTRP